MIPFPAGFHWGAATAAYQIEGSPRALGKGESIWDRFAHQPGRIRDSQTGDRACDSFARWGEDVALLRELGLSSYRFSISWPRIQADGRGPANPAGLDAYQRRIDLLLEAGIRPLPTLYHWDLPQALEDAGGWPSRDLAGRFADYAALAIRALGDRANDWILLNEPSIFTALGYWQGIHAPGRREPEAFLRATHTVNLAQGEACRAIRAERSGLRLGTAFNLSPCEPVDDSEAAAVASQRWHAFSNAWFLDPPLRGSYPEAFPEGLPEERLGIAPGDLERTRADYDFLGVNLYFRTRVGPSNDDALGLHAAPRGFGGGEQGARTDFGWEVWPDALRDALLWLTREYDGPLLEVTESGCSYGDAPGPDGRVRDARRIAYHQQYLQAVAEAMAEGAKVGGYHAWSLLDNFEWAEGFRQRFGLVHTDFDSGKRVIKDSGRWFARVVEGNALPEADESFAPLG